VSDATVRVATWNVHGLRTGVDAAAAVVRVQELDVLLVQESGPRRRLRALGDRLGWIVAADPWAVPRRRVHNAVLISPTRAALVRSRLLRFAVASFVHPRGALIADVQGGWTALSVHLGLRGPERGRQIAELAGLLEGSRGAFVAGADLNASPTDPGPSALGRVATDVWAAVGDGDGATFPSDRPTTRIDYLLVGEAVQALRAWTAGDRVSDHLMVVADLVLPD